MFGSHQRGFESHSLRSGLMIEDFPGGIINLKSVVYNFLGRCQSGRMGPPAKRLPGRNPRSQVRILSSPPQEKNAFREERVYVLSAKDTKSTKVDEHVRGLCLHPRRVDST